MAGQLPIAMFGLEVVPGDFPIAAVGDIPTAFRITMAAIDPTAEPEGEEGAPPRATLKIMRRPIGMDDESDDDSEGSFDADEMEAMLAEEDDDDDDEDDEMVNGGPSDPSKSKKARVAAIKKMLADEVMDVDGEDEKPALTNGVAKSAKSKGKMPASDEDEDEEEDDESDEDGEIEEFILCTLDPQKNYQQPLDLTIGEDEQVFFKVTGTHSIFLTGNYVEPADSRSGMYDPDSDDESDEDYDLEPDEDELEDEEDELDGMEDPRITELEDEEEAPKLVAAPKKKAEAVKAADKKANNKRPAEDEDEKMTIDELITQAGATNGEPKLSKKQLKKMKKNDGTAAAVEKTEEKPAADAPSSTKSDKKVSFAKDLEQGPTPTKEKGAEKAADSKDKPKATVGTKTVQGVIIDDKKLGSGPASKNGDRVGLRYIGKLQKDNKVFDSNKKGKPFSFKLGAGEVIKGWEIGIQGMSVGGERRITIPANLAYGSKGAGKDIPPNSTLVFDVKLLDLNKGK